MTAPQAAEPGEGHTLQERVQPWMMACFGPIIAADRIERNHRFIEEALELVQACGCTQDEAHQLVDYVYERPQGDVNQEVGGVMITLAALCLANGLDMHAAGETELARIWTKVDQIRAKQAAKPKHSPLPAAAPANSHARLTAENDVLRKALEAAADFIKDQDAGNPAEGTGWENDEALQMWLLLNSVLGESGVPA